MQRVFWAFVSPVVSLKLNHRLIAAKPIGFEFNQRNLTAIYWQKNPLTAFDLRRLRHLGYEPGNISTVVPFSSVRSSVSKSGVTDAGFPRFELLARPSMRLRFMTATKLSQRIGPPERNDRGVASRSPACNSPSVRASPTCESLTMPSISVQLGDQGIKLISETRGKALGKDFHGVPQPLGGADA